MRLRIEKGPDQASVAIWPRESIKLIFSGVGVAFLETFDTAFGIDILCFARIERMTLRTRIHMHLRDGGLYIKDGSARAGNRCIGIFRMNLFLHDNNKISIRTRMNIRVKPDKTKDFNR